MELTKEQKEIVRAFGVEDKIKIPAFAGTGKTTSLKILTEEYPDKRFLVLAFNRSVANELKRKMPPNAEVYTIHSLAYRLLFRGRRYPLKDDKEFVDTLIQEFDLDYLKASFIKDLFNAYCNSPYLAITPQNLLRVIFSIYKLKRKFFATYSIPKRAKDRRAKINQAVEELADILSLIFNRFEEKIGITHAYYLKRFQLEFDSFKRFFRRFDVVLVDEGQDLNGIQQYLLLNAPVPKKVIVGDRHQSIYSWRGAINTLAKLDWTEKPLTIPFRFENKEIPELANRFFENWKNEPRRMQFLEGLKHDNNKTAYITRTNAGLVELLSVIDEPIAFVRKMDEIFKPLFQAKKLLDYLNNPDFKPTGIPLYILKLAEQFIEELAEQFIEEGDGIEDFIKKFHEYGEFEIAEALRIASEYNIYYLYDKARKIKSSKSNIVLTTAHSAKGLEFREVILHEDFPDFYKYLIWYIGDTWSLENFDRQKAEWLIRGIHTENEVLGEVLDELNLQYVALTRAIEKVKGTGFYTISENFKRKLTPENLLKEVEKAKKKQDEYEGWF